MIELSLDDVRHVARLARLRVDDADLEEYRGQLDSVLEHIRALAGIDVSGVEPMVQPTDLVNRLDDDEVAPSMPVALLLAVAPAVVDRYLAVPKVLD